MTDHRLQPEYAAALAMVIARDGRPHEVHVVQSLEHYSADATYVRETFARVALLAISCDAARWQRICNDVTAMMKSNVAARRDDVARADLPRASEATADSIPCGPAIPPEPSGLALRGQQGSGVDQGSATPLAAHFRPIEGGR